jgi:hypothetical protein
MSSPSANPTSNRSEANRRSDDGVKVLLTRVG